MEVEFSSWRCCGRELHSTGAASLNDLEANVSFLMFGVDRSLPEDLDLSCLHGVLIFISSWMYLGAWPDSALWVISRILCWILYSIGSQWSSWRHFVALSYICLFRTSLAHMFWILWYFDLTSWSFHTIVHLHSPGGKCRASAPGYGRLLQWGWVLLPLSLWSSALLPCTFALHVLQRWDRNLGDHWGIFQIASLYGSCAKVERQCVCMFNHLSRAKHYELSLLTVEFEMHRCHPVSNFG